MEEEEKDPDSEGIIDVDEIMNDLQTPINLDMGQGDKQMND